MSSVRLRLSRVREIERRDLVIRFAFGAAVSVIAGIVSLAAGPRAGGLFLAFPAILPATLTLVQKKQSKREAIEDDEGAVLGAVGLLAFAGAAWALLPDAPGPAAIGGASLAWLVAAVALYAVVYGRRRGTSRRA
jgi:uncharacterized membrane protein (GlpM family)